MKTIILYGNRNTGIICLLYLLAKGYSVKLISNDMDILSIEPKLDVTPATFNTVGKFDLFICVHGTTILSKEFLDKGVCVNIHPCLSLGYKGHNPIKRYIEDKAVLGSVESHYMIEQVDEGEVICREEFETPICISYADFYNVALKHYVSVLDKTLEKLNIKP